MGKTQPEQKEVFKIVITVYNDHHEGAILLAEGEKIMTSDVLGAIEMFKAQFIADNIKPSPKKKKK